MDYLGIAVAIVFAIFWYRGAQMEKVPPLLWAGPSIVISALALLTLTRGWLGVVFGQVALIIVIALYRTMKGKPPGEG